MLRTAIAAAVVALVPVAALALSPPSIGTEPGGVVLVSQSIDYCYKKCFLDAKNADRKFACRRACNASRKKKCEDNCFSKLANDPKKRRACVSRCS
jgi:hypothetical protein